ncbi:hypothetical protein EQV77_06245 [Halobacillus fulvus]|nr:hypothetical protein EQV77_06245 [Halobacillus fulvus]
MSSILFILFLLVFTLFFSSTLLAFGFKTRKLRIRWGTLIAVIAPVVSYLMFFLIPSIFPGYDWFWTYVVVFLMGASWCLTGLFVLAVGMFTK